MVNISLDISLKEDIGIDLNQQDEVEIDFGYESVYTGSYEIDPSVDGCIIETANKRMMKDLKVKEISVSSVDNAQGGKTITIAGL